ncbi:MAG TPA: LPS assembly lipoprotein LptE [Nitrospiraceae bacterium]|nr:LPS assembly lipoprotein LptE [Nitrospiraceae bacterium]
MREKRDGLRQCASRDWIFACRACLASLACLALLVGCGYQFRVEGAGPTIGSATATSSPTSPPPRLVMRTLENKSFEPNLESRYTNYLRQEFSSGSGAQVVPESEAADLVLSGQILSVSLPTLSFTQTTTLESRAEVVVIVKVEETRTHRVVWTQIAKGASEFFVTTDLQFNRVLQNRALEQAGRFIAEDLASRFLLQLESGQLAKQTESPASDNADTTIK